MASVTNEKKAIYINTAPSAQTPVFNRLGEGITNWTPSLNGQTSTKHYINHKNSTTKRNGTQAQWAFSGDLYPGDAVNDFLVGLAEKTGGDVETQMLVVFMYDGAASPYKAKRYNVMVDISNDGTVEGGADVTIDGTFYAQGDPVEGTATIADGDIATFTATV